MIELEIKGIILEIFEPRYHYPKYSAPFLKRKIILMSGNEDFTLSFINEKNDYLKYCKIGFEINTYSKLKGRTWSFKNKSYSVNEILCSNLEIIKNTLFRDFIEIGENKYFVKKDFDCEILKLSLINVVDNSEIIICCNHQFPDKKINLDHIVISSEIDESIIEELQLKGVLIKEKWIRSGNNEGYRCKVLVLDLFDENNILYPQNFNNLGNNLNEDISPMVENESYYDNTDYSHFDENLDMDQQSDEFWNQF